LQSARLAAAVAELESLGECTDIVLSMPNRAIYLLVVEGFADWEPAHAIAELRRHGGYRVETVGLDRNPALSMGGLRITPSRTIDDLDINDVAAFILPGGDRWENMPMEAELESALKQLDARKVPIAAICAATVAISRVGLLHGRQHTSNGLKYLQSHVPEYREAQNYVEAPAVRDRGLITASGIADVEFARELFEELGVLSSSDRAVWADIFRNARLPDETKA